MMDHDRLELVRRVEDCARRLSEAEASLRGTRDTLLGVAGELEGATPRHEMGRPPALAKEKGKSSHAHRNGEPEGATQSQIVRYLRKEKSESEACMQLPGAIVLLFTFALMLHFHFRPDTLQAVDYALAFDVIENANFAFSGIVPFENGRIGHKNIYDVNNIPDFYSWFSLGLVPIWWPDQTHYGFSEVRANVD